MVMVRRERLEDGAAIFEVHASSFPSRAEARLVDALRESGRLSASVVAEEDGLVVGHVGFSPVIVGDGSIVGEGLAPVAVLPTYRRRGIAERLIREGLSILEQAGVGFVVVLGDPAYYGRFGFRAASAWGLKDEYEGGSAFQALELRPGTIPRGGGLVRFGPEFAELESDEA